MEEGRAFPQDNPPHRVTDPDGAKRGRGFREYPKHLHKAHGVYIVVNDEHEEVKQLAKGWRVKAYAEDDEAPDEAPKEPKHPRAKG